MVFIYNIFIFLYKSSIHIASFFNAKARQWVEGRKNIFTTIEQQINHAQSCKKLLPAPVTVWMHVASLGEFEQGRPLIEALKKEISPQYKIILTFFSPSGYEIRKNYPLTDHVFYLPMDSKKHARRFLDMIKPDLVIFVKYEFWYHYLHALKIRHIRTILISAIFNKNQLFVLNPYAIILKKMLGCFTHIFVQNIPSVSLLKKHGFEQVTCVGDTRIDQVKSIAAMAQSFPLIEQFVGSSPTLIGGSTWPPDEEILIQLLKNQAFTHYKFIIAPHDISLKNVDRLKKMLTEPSVRYSKCSHPSPLHPPKGDFLPPDESVIEGIFKENISDCRILIIDNIGMLSSIYQYGRVAYIGGGFGKGIHNTLEPIAFGLPVLFGTKYKKFDEAVQLIATGGAFSIADYKAFEAIMLYLNDEKNYLVASNAASKYVENNLGATNKIRAFIASSMTLKHLLQP